MNTTKTNNDISSNAFFALAIVAAILGSLVIVSALLFQASLLFPGVLICVSAGLWSGLGSLFKNR